MSLISFWAGGALATAFLMIVSPSNFDREDGWRTVAAKTALWSVIWPLIMGLCGFLAYVAIRDGEWRNLE